MKDKTLDISIFKNMTYEKMFDFCYHAWVKGERITKVYVSDEQKDLFKEAIWTVDQNNTEIMIIDMGFGEIELFKKNY